MEIEATYGHLFWQDGKRRKEAPPGIGLERPPAKPARGRDRDLLFVHLSLSSRDPAPASLYREVLECLSNAYFLSVGSVTAALRQAIRAANEYLMRHNTRMEGVSKQQGALTCAVLREEEVFLAQAGSPLGFIIHQGQMERLPPSQPGHLVALGVASGVDTRFYHSWISPGDVLLLVDPAFGDQSDSEIGTAVTFEGVEAATEKLAKMCKASGSREARLMLVEFSAVAPPPLVSMTGRVPGQATPAQTVAAPPQEPGQPVAVPTGQRPQRELPSVDIEQEARRAASGVAMGMARVAGGTGRLVGRLFEQGEPTGQAVKKDRGPSPYTLGLLAVLIPIVVGLVAIAVYSQRGQSERFRALLGTLERVSGDAQMAATDSDARTLWEQVISASDEALLIRPGNEAVLRFRSEANDKLDVLNEITRLQVRTLYTYHSASRLEALAVQSLAAYVLDSGADYVYRHRLADHLGPMEGDEPETLLFKTQAVAGEAVGELVDLSWLPKSGQIRADTVAVLDAGGMLLRYQPALGTLLSSALRLPPDWSAPVATAVYGDNYYVLDSGAGQIWRFSAVDDGFPEEPTAYRFEDNEDGDPSNDVDLGQMIDLTIDRDGNLYLLGSDGQVRKYFSGDRKPFTLTDLKEPLVSPSAVFSSLTGLNPFFYIADPGSGRVVQTTQQGLFMAQYCIEATEPENPFDQVSDIYVQEAPILAVYATCGDSLIVASLE